jgi:hypothetical protein
VQDEQILPTPRAAPPGTSPAVVLAANLEEARRAAARREQVALLLLWDGEDCEPSRTRKLAEQLAGFPHLKAVWVVGVTSDSVEDLRTKAEQTFKPLESRLIVSGRYDCARGLDDFRRVVQGG